MAARSRRVWALLLLAFLATFGCAYRGSAELVVEELRIPARVAEGEVSLEALVVRPESAARLPLVIVTHGSPRLARHRADRRATDLLSQAAALAESGWAAAVVVRRGYGSSGGKYAEGYGRCDDPDYVSAGKATAEDLRAAIRHLRGFDFVDASRIALIGQSAGGFGAVAISAAPPEGLVAAVSLAGGRGSRSSGEVCSPARLVAAFAEYGAAARIPMLWLYPDEKDYFPRSLVWALHRAYTLAGGTADLMLFDGGHSLFYDSAKIERWRPFVVRFLSEHFRAD